MNTYLKYTSVIVLGMVLVSCNHDPKTDTADRKDTDPEKNVSLWEPDRAFSDALTAFADGEYDKSAKDIRKGASVMGSILKRAEGQHKKKIENSIEELKELASDVERDHVEGINELNYFFGKAGRALAGYKIYVSRTEFSKLAPEQAGDSLMKTIDLVMNNLSYSNREMSEKEKNMIEKARSVAKRLKNGEKIEQVKIDLTYHDLRDQLNSWSIEFSDKGHQAKK